MADLGAGSVFAAINTAFRFSEFVIALAEVGTENHVFVRTIQRVRLDLEEVERLLAVPAIKGSLDTNPHKSFWIKNAVWSTKHALNDIGLYVERVRADKDRDGTISFAHRVRWVLKDHGMLENRRSELAACHQTLTTVLTTLHHMEEMIERQNVTALQFENAYAPPPTYEAALIEGAILSPYARKKARERAAAAKAASLETKINEVFQPPPPPQPAPQESTPVETTPPIPTPAPAPAPVVIETITLAPVPEPIITSAPVAIFPQEDIIVAHVTLPPTPPKPDPIIQIISKATPPQELHGTSCHNTLGPVDPWEDFWHCNPDEKPLPTPTPEEGPPVPPKEEVPQLPTSTPTPKPKPQPELSHRFSVASTIAPPSPTISLAEPTEHRFSISSDTFNTDYQYFLSPQENEASTYGNLHHSASSATLVSQKSSTSPYLHRMDSTASIISQMSTTDPYLHFNDSSATLVSQMTGPSRETTPRPLTPVAEMENLSIASELPAPLPKQTRPHSFSVSAVELPVYKKPLVTQHSLRYPTNFAEMHSDSVPHRRTQTQPLRAKRQSMFNLPPSFSYQTPIEVEERVAGYEAYSPTEQRQPQMQGLNSLPAQAQRQPNGQYAPYKPPPAPKPKPSFLQHAQAQAQANSQYAPYQPPPSPIPQNTTIKPQGQYTTYSPPSRSTTPTPQMQTTTTAPLATAIRQQNSLRLPPNTIPPTQTTLKILPIVPPPERKPHPLEPIHMPTPPTHTNTLPIPSLRPASIAHLIPAPLNLRHSVSHVSFHTPAPLAPLRPQQQQQPIQQRNPLLPYPSSGNSVRRPQAPYPSDLRLNTQPVRMPREEHYLSPTNGQWGQESGFPRGLEVGRDMGLGGGGGGGLGRTAMSQSRRRRANMELALGMGGGGC